MAVYNAEIAAANLSDAMKTPAVIEEVFQSAISNSICMQLGRRLPNMATGTARMSVLDLLPIAYFQATGTTVKQTGYQAWKGKTLTAEELAVIVPISENVLADATYVDIWGEVLPRIGEAMGKAIDAAVLHGTNLPSTWCTNTSGTAADIVAAATSASMTVASGTGVDLYDDILGADGTIGLVEAQGFRVNGHAAHIGIRKLLRDVRASRTETGAGVPIFTGSPTGTYVLDGERLIFSDNGAMNSAAAYMISGDWNQLVYSIRQDITPKLLTEAVITDADGAIQFNLAQQDMVAMRFTFRLAFQIANPVTPLASTEATRYPFAVLTPAAS